MRQRLARGFPFAAFGVLSTLFGMAVGHFVASLLNPASSPVLAVGSTVIDATPTPMKEWAIRQFGSADKVVLIGSVMIVVLILAAVAGLLARKRFEYGAGLEVLLVLVAGVAVLTRPTVETFDVVPVILTLLAGPAALFVLVRAYAGQSLTPAASLEDLRASGHPMAQSTPAGKHADGSTADSGAESGAGGTATATATLERDPERPSASRRTVLVVSGVVGVTAAVLAGAGRYIGNLRARPEDLALPTPVDPAPPLPQGLNEMYPDITPLRISNADFYRVDTRLDTPVVDSGTWTLTVDGDVENELSISFDELLEMDMIERDITMTCVSNSVGGPYVGGARWLGVPLQTILDMAGVGDTADQILSTDFDGMQISTPLDLATDGRDAMIVVGMNGEQLPREHGFPVRMIIPGLYGFISGTKWLTKLTLTTYEAEQAYWTERDWDTDAPIKISARIDTPQALQEVPAGKTIVGGVAWAQQSGGVGTVQVQIDGGPWQDAQLGPDVNNDYWRQWFFEWDAESGVHNVAARVIDGNEETQVAARAMPFPGGSSGIHSLRIPVA